MDDKNKTRRVKTTAWMAFILPFLATSMSSFSEQRNLVETGECEKNEMMLCGEAAPRDPYPFAGYVAGNVDYYEQPNFVRDYFRNLTENFPTNNSGNCGYVALAMLLSYYDTYWNSDFVPDCYNNPELTRLMSFDDSSYSSPGVNDTYYPVWTKANPLLEKPNPKYPDEKYESLYNENKRQAYMIYRDKMLGHTNDNIISRFYRIAIDRGIWDYNHEPAPLTNLYDIQQLSMYFFNGECGFRNEVKLETRSFTSFTECSERKEQLLLLREEIIERLTNGQPLIVGGNLSSETSEIYDPNTSFSFGNGHMAIAYDYDSSTDDIIGHIGWKGAGWSLVSFNKMFEEINSYAYVSVPSSIGYTCSNARFYGPCGEDWSSADLASHIHSDRVITSYGDDQYHALQCVCGDVTYEAHEFEFKPLDSEYHGYICKCGYVDESRKQRHLYVQRSLIDYECLVCGKRIVVPPNWYNL